MASFTEALDRNMDEIQRPPVPPIGHYLARVTKIPDPARVIDGKPFEILTVNLDLLEPQEDVDEDDLNEFVEKAGALQGTGVRYDFIFNTDPEEKGKFEATLNRFKGFLDNLGINVDEGTLKSQMAEMPNSTCLVQLGHRQDPNDPEIVYAEIKRATAA